MRDSGQGRPVSESLRYCRHGGSIDSIPEAGVTGGYKMNIRVVTLLKQLLMRASHFSASTLDHKGLIYELVSLVISLRHLVCCFSCLIHNGLFFKY